MISTHHRSLQIGQTVIATYQIPITQIYHVYCIVGHTHWCQDLPNFAHVFGPPTSIFVPDLPLNPGKASLQCENDRTCGPKLPSQNILFLELLKVIPSQVGCCFCFCWVQGYDWLFSIASVQEQRQQYQRLSQEHEDNQTWLLEKSSNWLMDFPANHVWWHWRIYLWSQLLWLTHCHEPSLKIITILYHA